MTSTDQDTMGKLRGKARSAWAGAAIFGLIAAGGFALAVTGSSPDWLTGAGLSQSRYDTILGIATGLSLSMALLMVLKARFPVGSGRAASRIDELQSRQRQVLIAITILTAGFGIFAIIHALHMDKPIETDFSIEFALLAIAVAATVIFGVGFARRRYRIAADDELVRLLRARASQLGYLLSITGLGTIYLIGQFRPDLTGLAFPIALLAAVVVPAVYFLIAERRASSND